jgi:hypothetical protein
MLVPKSSSSFSIRNVGHLRPKQADLLSDNTEIPFPYLHVISFILCSLVSSLPSKILCSSSRNDGFRNLRVSPFGTSRHITFPYNG